MPAGVSKQSSNDRGSIETLAQVTSAVIHWPEVLRQSPDCAGGTPLARGAYRSTNVHGSVSGETK